MENVKKEEMVLLKLNTFNAITNYLVAQPYSNVANLIPLLQEAQLVEEEVDAPTLKPVEDEKKNH
jgi:hypothetical protein